MNQTLLTNISQHNTMINKVIGITSDINSYKSNILPYSDQYDIRKEQLYSMADQADIMIDTRNIL